jgi:DNA-binding FrmR family transcriptional regulator
MDTPTAANSPPTVRRRAPGGTREQEIQARLQKAAGQLAGVSRMHADGRYCIDVLDQLSAVTAALDATALLILEDHIQACVRAAINAGTAEEKISELSAAVRRYVRSR